MTAAGEVRLPCLVKAASSAAVSKGIAADVFF